MSTSIGGLIKDYRIQKNISQLEIALGLGWKEPSRLSRIEQGRVQKPSRELLNTMMDLLDLKPAERNHLLFVGSYLPIDEEIELVTKETQPTLDKWQYTAILYDYSWRALAQNQFSKEIFFDIEKEGKRQKTKYPQLLEIIFDPHYSQNVLAQKDEIHKKNIEYFLIYSLLQFKDVHKRRINETWYKDLMKKLMRNELFVEIWQKSLKIKESNRTLHVVEPAAVEKDGKVERIAFNLFLMPIINNQRFEIEFEFPADKKTFMRFN